MTTNSTKERCDEIYNALESAFRNDDFADDFDEIGNIHHRHNRINSDSGCLIGRVDGPWCWLTFSCVSFQFEQQMVP